eukprot:TRINITY_DN49178_c0_g1_i1.p2 TRINITY_DN49178_c0_g1~~TRINITY_DN49178_c0_g1_i1.p2  ORF type:complete len:132 (+),score=37.51 TRINITY_DN49178_c0_g1_i1:106-501(+)
MRCMLLAFASIFLQLQGVQATKSARGWQMFGRVESPSGSALSVHGALSPVAAKTNFKSLTPSSATSRWSKHHKDLADVEDMDFFMGVPKIAWLVVCDFIACILFVVGVRTVTALARKRNDQEYEQPLQPVA